jgi:hypothetical protein
MSPRHAVIATAVLLAAATVAVFNYAARPPAAPPPVETLPDLPPPVETTVVNPDRRPPQPREVGAAVERVFTGAVPREAVRVHRAFAGDFNGDGSPDLAVPARVIAQLLPAIYGPYANWIIQDPHVALPHDAPPDPVRARTVIGGEDALLAVIHGYGAAGWRDTQSRQGYLLRGRLSDRVEVRPWKDLVERAAQAQRRLPFLRGDLIYEIDGHRFLYWTGARYLWHGMLAS